MANQIKSNRQFYLNELSPELIKAQQNALRVQQTVSPEVLASASKAIQAVAPSLASMAADTAKSLNDVAHRFADSPRVKDKELEGDFDADLEEYTQTTDDTLYATNNNEVLEKYFDVREPHGIDEYINCQTKIDEVKEIIIRFEKANRPDYIVHYNDMEITVEQVYELENFIDRMTAYLKAFREKLPDYDIDLAGTNLDYLCARHNIDREMLEKILGMGSHYFDRVLNPSDIKRRMSVEVLNNVCTLFGITVDSFLNDDLSQTMMSSMRKAIRFLDNLIVNTKERKIHWLDAPELKKMGLRVADAVAFEGTNRRDPISSEDCWETKTPAGSCYLVYKVHQSGLENYRLGLSRTEGIQWLFETDDDMSGNLTERCKRLHELITEQENEFFLNIEASQAMDDFLLAFDNMAVDKGKTEYIEEQLQEYRNQLEDKKATWMQNEFKKRYEEEMTNLKNSQSEFVENDMTERARKERISKEVKQKVEEEIDRLVEMERKRIEEG